MSRAVSVNSTDYGLGGRVISSTLRTAIAPENMAVSRYLGAQIPPVEASLGDDIEVVEPRMAGEEERRVRSALATQKKLLQKATKRYWQAKKGKDQAEVIIAELRAELKDTKDRLDGSCFIPVAALLQTLQCGICYDLNWRPALLSCGHGFCESCLKAYFQTLYERAMEDYFARDPVYTCPLCREDCVVKYAPQPCFIVKNLVEMVGGFAGKQAPSPSPTSSGEADESWSPFFSSFGQM